MQIIAVKVVLSNMEQNVGCGGQIKQVTHLHSD